MHFSSIDSDTLSNSRFIRDHMNIKDIEGATVSKPRIRSTLYNSIDYTDVNGPKRRFVIIRKDSDFEGNSTMGYSGLGNRQTRKEKTFKGNIKDIRSASQTQIEQFANNKLKSKKKNVANLRNKLYMGTPSKNEAIVGDGYIMEKSIPKRRMKHPDLEKDLNKDEEGKTRNFGINKKNGKDNGSKGTLKEKIKQEVNRKGQLNKNSKKLDNSDNIDNKYKTEKNKDSKRNNRINMKDYTAEAKCIKDIEPEYFLEENLKDEEIIESAVNRGRRKNQKEESKNGTKNDEGRSKKNEMNDNRRVNKVKNDEGNKSRRDETEKSIKNKNKNNEDKSYERFEDEYDINEYNKNKRIKSNKTEEAKFRNKDLARNINHDEPIQHNNKSNGKISNRFKNQSKINNEKINKKLKVTEDSRDIIEMNDEIETPNMFKSTITPTKNKYKSSEEDKSERQTGKKTADKTANKKSLKVYMSSSKPKIIDNFLSSTSGWRSSCTPTFDGNKTETYSKKQVFCKSNKFPSSQRGLKHDANYSSRTSITNSQVDPEYERFNPYIGKSILYKNLANRCGGIVTLTYYSQPK